MEFTLISKASLTHDVYELTYNCGSTEGYTPGQYVLFQLEKGPSRAYSIAHHTPDTFTLIIKRIADGRGSPRICDAPIGSVWTGLFPLGHFTLKPTEGTKCFIGTGTGFAPLYAMLLASRELTQRAGFIFGVREYRDMFYGEEIRQTLSRFPEGEYIPHLSREQREGYHEWYVSEWAERADLSRYHEYYICGSKPMVDSVRTILEQRGVPPSQIAYEKY